MSEYNLAELVEQREKAIIERENLDAAIKVISDEMLLILAEMGVNGTVVSNKSISKVTRLSFSTALAEAREYGATKEVIDSDVLKKLYNKGLDIKGVKVSEFIMVRNIESNE